MTFVHVDLHAVGEQFSVPGYRAIVREAEHAATAGIPARRIAKHESAGEHDRTLAWMLGASFVKPEPKQPARAMDLSSLFGSASA